MKLRFACDDREVIHEVCDFVAPLGIEVLPRMIDFGEVHTEEPQRLVSDRLLNAFKYLGKPVFVEYSGLQIRSLNGFPGGLTQVFWDRLLAERFSAFIGRLEDPTATAQTLIGYCDGRKRHFFEGRVEGRIATTPAGPQQDWSCVFIPDGLDQTLAQLGSERRLHSMRRQALESLARFIKER